MLGNVKIAYAAFMKDRVKHLPLFNKPIQLHYRVYTGSTHKSDIMNWVAVIDKFFQDVLVQEGKLVDDNYDYVNFVSAEFIQVDKQNPRVEIDISTDEPEPINIFS